MSKRMRFDLRHNYLEIAGLKLHWAEMGINNAEPPIILIHGLNDCYLTWTHIAVDLAKYRRVVMPDLPGHGLSERPDASYKLHWHAQVMAMWLEALGIEQADIVGHSFGGGVAQMLLRECRQRIRRLVLLSSGGLGREVAFELRLASLPWVVENLGQPFMAMGTWLALWHIRHVLSIAHIAELSSMNSQRGSARAFARTVGDVIDWRGQRRSFFQHAHELSDLPPMALYWGDRDRIIPAEHAYAMAEVVDGLFFKVFDGCGHYPHHEQPLSVAKAFRDFFDAPSLCSTRLRMIEKDVPLGSLANS